MLSEELHVIGILDENKASGSIKAEDLRALICDYLQLAPYHPVLIEVLTQNNVSLEGQAKIDIQDIFRATNTSHFNKNVPSVNEVLEKIVLVMSEIRDGASAHKMKEFENLSVGVTCNVQTVHSILWVIRKTINNALLEKWISAHSGVLDQPGLLMAHEFMYLLCNCVSKTEMMDKIPKIPMNPKMDKKTHLFKIDKDFGKTYETPDHKIQHIMSTYYNVDKAYIEGIATKAVVTEKITKKTHRHQPSKNEPNKDDEENLRKQLRGMVMTVGIKVKLKEYHQKLIRSRLNGKSAFDKLIAQAHGQNTLPSPLDLHSQGNLTAGNNLSPKKIWGIPNRPQTAQMFHNKSLSSPFHLNLNTPIKSDRNLQKFLETDSIKGFNSVSVNRVPALNTNLPKTPVGRSSRGSINPAILKNMNPRKSSELLSQGLGYQEPEIIPPMERAIDEEFEKFQSQNKSGLKPKAPRRQTYFNSAINPSAARIYSSRPESPHIQASPLASKFFL